MSRGETASCPAVRAEFSEGKGMSEWKQTTLGNVSIKIGSGATPRGGSNSYKEAGISLIRSQNILDFKFSTDGLAYIDDDQADDLQNVTVEKNDVLLNITGDSVARCCIVPISALPARVNQHVSIVRLNSEKASHSFIFYLLQSMKEELLMQSEIGATRRALTKGMIESLEILLPPLPEQKAIASVLSSLDDKIDLLHRQNKTLEAIAETLFRQWFIEEAQEDWDEGTVQDYCIHYKEGIKPQDFPTKTFSHYSIPSFDQNMNPVSESGSEIRSNKYSVVPYCLLFSKLNPNKDKRIWLILDQPGENPICSTEFQVVLPKEQKHLYFIYGWLSIPQNYNEIASSVGGTSGSHQRIDPADIFNFPCPRMDETYLDQFNAKVEPLFRSIQKNHIQIRTLEKLRDTLLPKLMSGEVRITL